MRNIKRVSVQGQSPIKAKYGSLIMLSVGLFLGAGLVILALAISGTGSFLVPAGQSSVDLPEGIDSGEGCSTGPEGSIPLINQDHGYCFRYQEGFTEKYPNANMTMLVGQTPIQEPNHSELHIEVTPANGRSAHEIADEILADINAALPDYEVPRTPFKLGGEPAVLLENVPGQELSQQVIAVHNDRLYRLSFLPWNDDGSRISGQLADLFLIVVSTFEFHG